MTDFLDIEPLPPGHIRFYHSFVPALSRGDYELEVEQRLERNGVHLDTFTSRQRFRVEHPRLGLGASDVHAVYPPADSEGDYVHTLPHIVLRRRTLPWEIDLGSTGSHPRPWVALLEFHPGEEPEVQIGSAGALLAAGANGEPHRPVLGLRPHEADQLVAVIDVADFQAIRPFNDDLPYLSHARQVRIDDKEMLGLDDDGWFSVVIANRLPKAGRNVAHLVSLQGVDLRHGSVRLVSLARWSFTAEADRGSFVEKIGRITSGLLRSSTERSTPPADQSVADIVDDALAAGFVPFRYDMRHGEQSVAWYRGPLVPTSVAPVERGPLETADAGLITQPTIGMFDVSLAIAWQLGRLLGLSDATFHRELMRWRRELQAVIDTSLARDEVVRQHGQVALYQSLRDLSSRASALRESPPADPADQDTPGEDQEAPGAEQDTPAKLAEDVRAFILDLWDPSAIAAAVGQFAVDDVLARLVDQLPPPRDDKHRLVVAPPPNQLVIQPPSIPGDETPSTATSTPTRPNAPGNADAAAHQALEAAELQAAQLALAELASVEVPEAIQTWLGRLALLYGVPFEHLVPHESMLPPESIRFFHLDTNWLEALVDGAFSVGVHSDRDIRFRLQLQRAIRAATDIAAGTLRRGLLGSTPATSADGGSSPRAGFLMRSEVVAGWPGIEVRGTRNEHGELLPVGLLRLDRPAPDLLFAIFDGVPDRVDVAQPPEALHFGLSQLEEGLDQEEPPFQIPHVVRDPSHSVLKVGSADGLVDATKRWIEAKGEPVPPLFGSAHLAIALRVTAGSRSFEWGAE